MLPPLKAAQNPQLHGGVWQRSSPSTGGTEIRVVDHREDFRSLEGIFKQLLYYLGVPFWPGHNPHSLWRIQTWALEAAEQNSEYYIARQGPPCFSPGFAHNTPLTEVSLPVSTSQDVASTSLRQSPSSDHSQALDFQAVGSVA